MIFARCVLSLTVSRKDSMEQSSWRPNTATCSMFENLKAVAVQAGGDLDHVVKLTIYLTDLDNFATVNSVMADYFQEPYPARAALGVASLPKGTDVEAEAILSV